MIVYVLYIIDSSFFDTQHNYIDGLNTFQEYKHVSNLKFDTITIFDHACLHRTLKSEGGLRGSIDVGLKLNSSDGLFKQKDVSAKTSIELLTNPLVMNTDEELKVQAENANDLHVVVSYLEIS